MYRQLSQSKHPCNEETIYKGGHYWLVGFSQISLNCLQPELSIRQTPLKDKWLELPPRVSILDSSLNTYCS